MSEINDLRERVEAAEARFGLIDEQQRHYSDRVIGLIETIEAQLATARSEIENQIAENQRLNQENEELRGMLHSVLRSIEEKTFTRTLQNLEAKVSALVGGAQAAGSAAEVPAAAVEESASAAPDEPEAVVEADDAAALESEAEMILEAAPEEDLESAAGEEAAVGVTAEENEPEMPEEPAETAAEDLPEEPAEALAAEPVSEEEAFEPAVEAPEAEQPALAEDAMTGAEDDIAAAEDLPEENLEAEADAVAQDLSEPAMEAADEIAEIASPEEVMSNVAFEDDPQAVAESDGDAGDPETAAEAETAALEEAAEDMAAEDVTAGELAPEEMAPDDAAAGDNAGTAVEAAFDQLAETAAAASQAQAGGGDTTPTVKEIIRRVGDLARELEKAEAQRKAAQQTAQDAEAETAAPAGAVSQDPPFDQAANA